MRAGILIIGSLLWDDQGREHWRQSRLDVDQKVLVQTPIRYGRLSQGNTFTMTFAPGDSMGQAVLVPCRAPIADVDSLVAEVRALWKAEDRNASPHDIVRSWGCVGALFGPGGQFDDLQQAWAAHFSMNVPTPIPPVDENGVLDIPWPMTALDGASANVDIILATATKPRPTPPSAEDIAEAWVDQNNRHERYFFENVRHGIRTSDDGLIWRRIEQRNPDWLDDPAYAEAIGILQA